MTPVHLMVRGDRAAPMLPVREHLRVVERRVAPPGYDRLCPVFSVVDGHLTFVKTISTEAALATLVAGEA